MSKQPSRPHGSGSGQQDPEEDGYLGDNESSRAPRRKRTRKSNAHQLGDTGSGLNDAGGSHSTGAGEGASDKPVRMAYGTPNKAQLGLMKVLAGFATKAKDAMGRKGGKDGKA